MVRRTSSPLAAALDSVGDRWTLLLVEALLDGPRRFGEREPEQVYRRRRLIAGAVAAVVLVLLIVVIASAGGGGGGQPKKSPADLGVPTTPNNLGKAPDTTTATPTETATTPAPSTPSAPS